MNKGFDFRNEKVNLGPVLPFDVPSLGPHVFFVIRNWDTEGLSRRFTKQGPLVGYSSSHDNI